METIWVIWKAKASVSFESFKLLLQYQQYTIQENIIDKHQNNGQLKLRTFMKIVMQ